MNTITISISDPVYQDFQERARRLGRPATELIREALEEYWERHLPRTESLRQRRPASAGGPVVPLAQDTDLLSEMLDANSTR